MYARARRLRSGVRPKFENSHGRGAVGKSANIRLFISETQITTPTQAGHFITEFPVRYVRRVIHRVCGLSREPHEDNSVVRWSKKRQRWIATEGIPTCPSRSSRLVSRGCRASLRVRDLFASVLQFYIAIHILRLYITARQIANIYRHRESRSENWIQVA